MTESNNHARAFDIPGWACPARVRDIPRYPNSWGWVRVGPTEPLIARDELAYLWVKGDYIPTAQIPDESDSPGNPGALVYWTPSGIGLWLHPRSLSALGYTSETAMRETGHEQVWLPVNEVAAKLPRFIRQSMQERYRHWGKPPVRRRRRHWLRWPGAPLGRPRHRGMTLARRAR